MLEVSHFYISILFRRVLEECEEHCEPASNAPGPSNAAARANPRPLVHNLLDLDGPPLGLGLHKWTRLYKSIGCINWIGKPTYLSLAHKVALVLLTLVLQFRIVPLVLEACGVLDGSFNNPILVTFTLIAACLVSANFFLIIHETLFSLGPIIKILDTPKLCQASVECLQMIGWISFKVPTIFILLNTILLELTEPDRVALIEPTYLLLLIPKLVTQAVMLHYVVGTSHFDFYIRTCFGCWILGLRFNLESRFQRFNAYKQHQLACWRKQFQANGLKWIHYNNWPTKNQCNNSKREMHPAKAESGSSQVDQFKLLALDEYQFIPMVEMQKNLNNMDDHLEISRLIQASSLILITLNAFVTNGNLFVLSYDLIVNRNRPALGIIMSFLGVSFSLVIMWCYIGDQWLSYALNSLVQFIEDEYFVSGGEQFFDLKRKQIRTEVVDNFSRLINAQLSSPTVTTTMHHEWPVDGDQAQAPVVCETDVQPLIDHLENVYNSLLISRADVLFYREFLLQFENHLATPWTRLTLDSHLRIISAFVTLVAAQIIFDQKH